TVCPRTTLFRSGKRSFNSVGRGPASLPPKPPTPCIAPGSAASSRQPTMPTVTTLTTTPAVMAHRRTAHLATGPAHATLARSESARPALPGRTPHLLSLISHLLRSFRVSRCLRALRTCAHRPPLRADVTDPSRGPRVPP